MSTSVRTVLVVVAIGAGAAYAWLNGLDPRKLTGMAQTTAPQAEADKSKPAATAAPATKAVAPPALVVAADVVTEPFVVNKRTIGYVEPIAQVVIKSRIDSQIATQNVRDGAMVKAGDVLFTLDDRELKAQVARDEAQLDKDKATLVRTIADLQRKQDLVAKGAGTPQAFDQAVADEGVARATLAADEAAVNVDKTKLGYTIITSPISGRAGAVQVTPGNVVKALDVGPGLVTITQIQPIRVTMQISEIELPKLQALFAAKTPPQVNVYRSGTTNRLATATATFIDSAIDIASGTVALKAEYANADSALWPGMFVDVDVALETMPTATVIPTVAMQIGQKNNYVFVLKPDQTVELRPITVKATQGPRLAVATGLTPGEKVIIEGQGRLVDGAKVRVDTKPAQKTTTKGALVATEKSSTDQGE